MRVVSLKLITGEVVLLKDEKLTAMFLEKLGKYVTQGAFTKVAKNPKQLLSLIEHVNSNLDKFKASYKQQTGKDLDEAIKEKQAKDMEEAHLAATKDEEKERSK